MLAKPVYDTIICFGDSLTQQASGSGGFVSNLQDVYQRRLEVISRGFSGYTSRQAITLCPKLFEQTDVSVPPSAKLATIWFGTNDAIRPGYAQHVPLPEFHTNMFAVLHEYFAQVDVILITPTTVVPDKFDGHEDDSSHVVYGEELKKVAEEVNEARKKANNAKRVFHLDMRILFLQAAARDGDLSALFQEDGLHISPQGYKVVFDGIRSTIETNLPDLTPDKLPYVVPDWKTLNLQANSQGQHAQLEPKYTPVV